MHNFPVRHFKIPYRINPSHSSKCVPPREQMVRLGNYLKKGFLLISFILGIFYFLFAIYVAILWVFGKWHFTPKISTKFGDFEKNVEMSKPLLTPRSISFKPNFQILTYATVTNPNDVPIFWIRLQIDYPEFVKVNELANATNTDKLLNLVQEDHKIYTYIIIDRINPHSTERVDLNFPIFE